MRKKLNIILFTALSASVLWGCGVKGEFDSEGYKILHFGDEAFMQRAIEQCDANGDGKLSIKEASDVNYITYNGNSAAGLDLDNASGDYAKIRDIREIHYFRYVQVLPLGGNDLSGILDLEKLTALRILDLRGNTLGRLTKIVVNQATRGSLSVLADEEIEIEYYGYTGDDDEDEDKDEDETGGDEDEDEDEDKDENKEGDESGDEGEDDPDNI